MGSQKLNPATPARAHAGLGTSINPAAIDPENSTHPRAVNRSRARTLQRYPWGDKPQHDKSGPLAQFAAGMKGLDERRRFALVIDEDVGQYTIVIADSSGSWIELASAPAADACDWAWSWVRSGRDIYHVSPLGVPVVLYSGYSLLAADCVHVIQEQAGRWTMYRYQPQSLPETLLRGGTFGTALNMAAKLVPKGVRVFIMPKGKAW
jgi:hypothetical protein